MLDNYNFSVKRNSRFPWAVLEILNEAGEVVQAAEIDSLNGGADDILHYDDKSLIAILEENLMPV